MLATVLGILIGIAVPLASFVTGLRTTDPLWLWKRPRLLARSLLTILVAVPVVAVLIVEVLAPANVVLKAGIVVSVLAIGVGPPDLMNRSDKAKDVAGYEIGLDFVLMTVAIVYLPVAVAIHGAIFHHSLSLPWSDVARVVLLQAILPFFGGFAVARWLPHVAAPLERHAPKIVAAAMAIVAGVALLATGRILIGLGPIAWLTCAVIAAVAILIGHVTGGRTQETRTVLAGYSVVRFPALALLLVSIIPRGQGRGLIPIVLAYIICSSLLVALYRALTGHHVARRVART